MEEEREDFDYAPLSCEETQLSLYSPAMVKTDLLYGITRSNLE